MEKFSITRVSLMTMYKEMVAEYQYMVSSNPGDRSFYRKKSKHSCSSTGRITTISHRYRRILFSNCETFTKLCNWVVTGDRFINTDLEISNY
jgi:hypothetical protein